MVTTTRGVDRYKAVGGTLKSMVILGGVLGHQRSFVRGATWAGCGLVGSDS